MGDPFPLTGIIITVQMFGKDWIHCFGLSAFVVNAGGNLAWCGFHICPAVLLEKRHNF